MPAPGTSELNFIQDPDLRFDIRVDIAAINRAFANGEWKAATVLAGSVIETLLLSELQRRDEADVLTAVSALGSVGSSKTKKPLDEWYLADYIEVTLKLNIIGENTAKQIRLAQDFRNLIHPGRAHCLAQKCDRSRLLRRWLEWRRQYGILNDEVGSNPGPTRGGATRYFSSCSVVKHETREADTQRVEMHQSGHRARDFTGVRRTGEIR